MNSENWKDYPYLVEWVEQMNAWAAKYQIYEFIEVDVNGHDSSGRIRLSSDQDVSGEVDEQFVWSLVDSVSEKYVISGDFPHSDLRGWYVGRVSHGNEKLTHDAGRFACLKCEGKSYFLDSEDEAVDCDLCMAGETSLWVDLNVTDFHLPRGAKDD